MRIALSGLIVMLASTPGLPHLPTHDYYPVNAGDRWEYESSARGRFSNEVLSVEESVARVRSIDAGGRVSQYDVEIRGDSIMLRPDGQNIRLLVDFGVPLGGSFIGSAGPNAETVAFRAEHDSLVFSGLVLRNVREYQHRPEVGGHYTSYYARGFGLVAIRWDSGMSVRLVAAEVGGRSIGRE